MKKFIEKITTAIVGILNNKEITNFDFPAADYIKLRNIRASLEILLSYPKDKYYQDLSEIDQNLKESKMHITNYYIGSE